MKVLVTGATGFVGPRVVHALRAHEHDVRCLVRDRRRARTLETWGCELVTGDVTDAATLGPAVDGVDAIVHLVSIIAGRPETFDRVMVQGTRALVSAAQGRFVLMSALGVSEETKDLVPYYHAKWEMERAVRESGLDHVIFRPSFVFGHGGVLPLFMRQVRWSPVVPVVGDGRTRLQPIWVDDVAEFFAAGVESDAASGRTFDLGGPDAVTWDELYARIRRVLGVRRATVHVPFGLVRPAAALAERLPHPPVTRDQLTMLAAGDNVCDVGPASEALGVHPIGLDEQLRRAA
jgi:NADH dehydrogenase